MKRIVLFLATNIAVLVVASVILQVFGIEDLLRQQGIGTNLTSLLLFAAVFGMTGSFISLLMSKKAAKWQTGAKVIGEPRSDAERWLFQTVQRHASASGIDMPEVAVYDSPAPNAFATGARRNSALVAVSTGLLQSMRREEVDAVLAHEVSHVANGDMVTLTLIQGILNTFVIFLSRIVGMLVDSLLRRGEGGGRGGGLGYFVATIAAQIVFGVLASIVVMWFSRQREFRADAGAARLTGAGAMISALERLKAGQPAPLPDSIEALGISGGVRGGLGRLLASHPPIDERIAALRALGG
jgi:heat shock protein HtpX